MNESLTTTADRRLQAEIGLAFAGFSRLLPDSPVKAIHSYGMAEDHLTLCILIDLDDGAEVMISIAPGDRIHVAKVA